MEEINMYENEINKNESEKNQMIGEKEELYEEYSEPQKEPTKKSPLSLGAILLTTLLGFSGGVLGFIFMTDIIPSASRDVIYQTVERQDVNGNAITDLKAVEVAEMVKESVVEISTATTVTHPFFGQYVTEGAGSGVIFSKEGLIITNNHVVNGSNEIKILLSNGDEHKATLIASDIQTDLAVLRIDAKDLKPVVLGKSETMKVGEDIYAVGNPLGSLGGTVTEGILSAKDREIAIDGQMMTLFQISAAINPGNSGGGLFNNKGELVGIVNAKSSGTAIEGLGFAIPIDIAKDVVEDLVKNGEVTGRLTLGIKYYEISDISTAMQFNVNTVGLLDDEVTKGSNADKAGIKKGDIIVEADDKQVTTGAELTSALRKHKAGETMSFMVVRNKEFIDLNCVLEEGK